MYTLVITKAALKELLALPTETVQRIRPRIDAPADDPHPPGCKKLQGSSDLWRTWIGDYRVIYAISEQVRIVEVRTVGHRRDVYD